MSNKDGTGPHGLTIALARKLLRYDPETGHITRRVRRGKFAAGTRVGYPTESGYRMAGIGDHQYLEHCLAVFLQTGKWPPTDVHHGDHDGLNNKWKNLEVLTSSEHKLRAPKQVNNKSGIVGVCRDVQRDQWLAWIQRNGVPKFLGRFDRKADAVAARQRAEREFDPPALEVRPRRTREKNHYGMTAERARKLLRYNPVTGHLFHRISAQNGCNAGGRAGSVGFNGYRYITLDGHPHQETGLIWLIMTGEWPKWTVNHIDYDPANNRWRNLELATQSEQMRKTRVTLMVKFRGMMMALADVYDIGVHEGRIADGVNYKCFRQRVIGYGWTLQQAASTPFRSRRAA